MAFKLHHVLMCFLALMYLYYSCYLLVLSEAVTCRSYPCNPSYIVINMRITQNLLTHFCLQSCGFSWHYLYHYFFSDTWGKQWQPYRNWRPKNSSVPCPIIGWTHISCCFMYRLLWKWDLQYIFQWLFYTRIFWNWNFKEQLHNSVLIHRKWYSFYIQLS